MNFEAAQIHFLRDVFAAVAVVVLLMQLMFTVHIFFLRELAWNATAKNTKTKQ